MCHETIGLLEISTCHETPVIQIHALMGTTFERTVRFGMNTFNKIDRVPDLSARPV